MPASAPVAARFERTSELDADRAPATAAASMPAPVASPKAKDADANREAAAGTVAVRSEPMLVYEARLGIAVFQVAESMDAVERIAKDAGGHLGSRTDRTITIRVPRAAFDEAVRRVEATGDVLHRDIRSEDVTDHYRDLEIRLRNARAMRDRLADLLAKADVKESLEIERELARVAEQVELLTGELKSLSDRVAFSAITIDFQPRAAETVHDEAMRLPFPWLGELGLARLLDLR